MKGKTMEYNWFQDGNMFYICQTGKVIVKVKAPIEVIDGDIVTAKRALNWFKDSGYGTTYKLVF